MWIVDLAINETLSVHCKINLFFFVVAFFVASIESIFKGTKCDSSVNCHCNDRSAEVIMWFTFHPAHKKTVVHAVRDKVM